jgi:hypothetical protein
MGTRPVRTAPDTIAVPPTAEAAVERIVQLFDEIEDILSVLRQQLGLWPVD